MAEFAAGAAFGAVIVLLSLVVFVSLFGRIGEGDDDDEWDPWGRGT